jgi:hypothetical protein
VFRIALRREPDQLLTAYLLNNLSFTNWMHLLELSKITDEEQKQQILKEESSAMSFFKESIRLQEIS